MSVSGLFSENSFSPALQIFAGMSQYTGIYYIQGGAEYAATFSFLKDKLTIAFKDEQSHDRLVFWYYDEIADDKQWQNGKTVITYKGYPKQVIEINSKQFIEELEKKIQTYRRSFLLKVVGHSLPLLRVLLILLLLLLIAWFWLVPYLAVRLAVKVPVSYEVNLGRGMYSAIKDGLKIDEKRTAYINDFFTELKIMSPYAIHITVVRDDTPNAFALPGGNIIVYDKILAGMNKYDELAALLSHEFAHIQNRHTTKSLFRQMGNSVFLNVIVGNTGALGNVIINNAGKLKNLSYSRNLEREADLEGLKILSERKIDCNGFTGLFEMLKKLENNIPASEWMSSHPDLDNRVRYIKGSPFCNKADRTDNETLKTLFLKIKTAE